ncbi:MAG: class I SAM-dependent methyltransferase [Nostoc sp.]|uniref:class I SAM-dependent methyltransferase n=1 Tax=Nostoc sp. TaxID=1180 RepID=UPI002FFC86AE
MLNQIIEAIKEAESTGLISTSNNDVLTGLSGNKLVGSLQRIAALFSENKDTCYLEVGVFQGLTLLSVANACPSVTCYGIDNFAQFDPKGENFGIVKSRMDKLGIENARLLNKDYEDALETLEVAIGEKKVGLYFIDGPHDYRSQLMCLELALPYLHDNAVIIIDDSNYKHVRQANRDFLVTHPEYKLVFEAYTKCHPVNMTKTEEEDTRKGWWNGVNIIVKDLENKLKPMYPPTERSRILYENEHNIHALKIAELAPQSVAIIQSLYEVNLPRTLLNIFKFYQALRHNAHLFKNRYRVVNTYSADLPTSNYNTLV